MLARDTASGSTREPLLLGLDVGSTHAKAGLFALDGRRVAFTSRPMPLRRTSDGGGSFDPEEVCRLVQDAIRELVDAEAPRSIAAVGVASMAESGLLLDASTGAPRSHLIPWFDTTAAPDAQRLAAMDDPFERFRRTGLSMSYKAGTAKILSQVRTRGQSVTAGAKWLFTADFIVYRLTGVLQTDPTLAARTHAFDIHRRKWDEEWLERASVYCDVFPRVAPSGSVAGEITPLAAEECGLTAGMPVAVAGHDHIVAAYALGILGPGRVLDSMGTAESIVGALPQRELTRTDFEAGLVFGPHIAADTFFWMGALSASGGSIEWLRTMLADPYVSYEHLLSLLARAPAGPSSILYFPYLAGAQAPQPDGSARGAFVGLKASHTASDLALAVLQGTAYEVERIRRSAASIAGPIDDVVAVGGGTRIRRWLQIKADVSGRPIVASPHAEATALGAALLAGLGAGVYRDEADSRARVENAPFGERSTVFQPDPVEHRLHVRLLEGPYTALQTALREASHGLASALREEEGDA
ncbi:MAG: FGGY-family carbohydrate kinase [Nitrososphaerales archaeon]